MAAITDLTVESTAPTVVEVDWTDNGEVNTLYRAPFGGAYTSLATVTGLATYSNTTAVAATRYQYKITSGVSGDSNVDDVVAQTCATDTKEPEDLALPSFEGDEQQDDLLNQMARDLEGFVNTRLAGADPCEICSSNGAITIDCSRCSDFNVAMTEDINSISMVNCDGGGDGTMNFHVPTGTTRCICGFPQTFGFEGGECLTQCASGGTGAAGKTFLVGFTRTANGPQAKPFPLGTPTTGSGGGGAGATCQCSPTTPGQLTLKCCTTDCSLVCATTKSLKLIACGGMPFTVGKAYTWAVTGGLTMVVSSDGRSATITPPTNSGSGVSGNAYRSCGSRVSDTATCDNPIELGGRYYGCNDQDTGPVTGPQCGSTGSTTYICCGSSTVPIVCASCTALSQCVGDGAPGAHIQASGAGVGEVADERTAQMITDGCNPCGLATDSKVVTVTDALSVSVSKTLQA